MCSEIQSTILQTIVFTSRPPDKNEKKHGSEIHSKTLQTIAFTCRPPIKNEKNGVPNFFQKFFKP
jgi:hypothetical protein